MNRRNFLQSLVAVISLPSSATFALRSATASVPAAVVVPTQARFWTIYMAGLHGECTPRTLQNLLHIPEVDAKRYIGQLVADGVIKPNPLLQKSASRLLKSNEDGLWDNIRKRLDMKAQPEAVELEPHPASDETGCLDSKEEPLDAVSDDDSEVVAEEYPAVPETQIAVEIKAED